MPRDFLPKFTALLEGIDLAGYRQKYQPVKIVEMDMSKDVQAIELLYKVYWTEKLLLPFEEFYGRYLAEKGALLEAFRERVGMCKTCFYKGLPARIYRTWASILTQIHAGYVAESVFGPGTVKMSADLDHKGADFRIEPINGQPLNIQVKKSSYSREVRADKGGRAKLDGVFLTIEYVVLKDDDLLPNKYGKTKPIYERFKADEGLRRLKNGFVLFTPKKFESLQQRFRAGEL